MKKYLICSLLVLFVVGLVAGCGNDETPAKASEIGQVEKTVSSFMDVLKETGSKDKKDRGSEPLKKAESLVADKDIVKNMNEEFAAFDGKFEVSYMVKFIELDVEDGKANKAEARVFAVNKVKGESRDGEFQFSLEKKSGKWVITSFSM